ncbi:MAG: type IVB secretion system protein IcmH/DotU [Ectothiorhodospiraceae bacterium]|nr:type IVB secretion system protein IcmH/DotU [Ectothiorhodospiraceae bacterium]
MSSDNSDKTVFRQPVNKGDGTVVRPMPGGRAPSSQTEVPNTPVTPPPNRELLSGNNPEPKASFNVGNNTHHITRLDVGSIKAQYSINPLVNFATILIAVFSKTRETVSHANVGGLHQQLVTEIKSFEENAKEEGVSPEIILAARYILCTVLDEAVLHTPWGTESAWTQRTLLSVFHNETEGGEKFYLILDRMKSSPAENIDILELMYIFLSLGYEGKYRFVHNGRELLAQIRDDIFHITRNVRGEYERTLSPSWQGLGKGRNTLTHFVPLWVIAVVVSGIMVLSYSGLRVWMHESTAEVANQLTEISNNDFTKKSNSVK